MKKVIVVALTSLLVSVTAASLFFLLDKPEIDEYEKTTLKFEVLVEIKNQGNAQAVDIPLRLSLPLDDEDDHDLLVFDPSVEPVRETNDSIGNRFVHFTIPELDPGEVWNVSIEVEIILRSIDYRIDPNREGDLSGFDQELMASGLIDFNEPNVQTIARHLSNGSQDIKGLAWNTYEWIIDNLAYQQIPGEWSASTTLKNGEGGSAEFANVFVALMRANGIPARRLSGWGNHFERGEELTVNRFAHGWAEFYAPGYGWMQVDPTWGRVQKFENFAKTDDSHVVMTRGEGVHFMTRGAYSEPFGDTEVDTDYSLKVIDVDKENLSTRRDMMTWIMILPPFVFAAFVIYKKLGQRRV